MESQNQDSICTCDPSTCKSAQKRSFTWGTPAGILGISSMFSVPVVITLFFCGIGGFSIFNYIYYTGYPLSILGLICSIVSIVKKERILGLAIPGLVCSIFGFFEALISDFLLNHFNMYEAFSDCGLHIVPIWSSLV
ncbi:MAG: hypothetical protein K2O34_06155 [Acetatifactor sp.]|nr:hypothetical protein [Acetatifactor sp.]